MFSITIYKLWHMHNHYSEFHLIATSAIFIKKFVSAGYLYGEVIEFQERGHGKFLCKLTPGNKRCAYTRDELELYGKTQVLVTNNNQQDESGGSKEESYNGSDTNDDGDKEVMDGAADGENEAAITNSNTNGDIVDEYIPVVSIKKGSSGASGNFVRKLTTIPGGSSTKQHLHDLKERPSACTHRLC